MSISRASSWEGKFIVFVIEFLSSLCGEDKILGEGDRRGWGVGVGAGFEDFVGVGAGFEDFFDSRVGLGLGKGVGVYVRFLCFLCLCAGGLFPRRTWLGSWSGASGCRCRCIL